jgi:hypothetical protein
MYNKLASDPASVNLNVRLTLFEEDTETDRNRRSISVPCSILRSSPKDDGLLLLSDEDVGGDKEKLQFKNELQVFYCRDSVSMDLMETSSSRNPFMILDKVCSSCICIELYDVDWPIRPVRLATSGLLPLASLPMLVKKNDDKEVSEARSDSSLLSSGLNIANRKGDDDRQVLRYFDIYPLTGHALQARVFLECVLK